MPVLALGSLTAVHLSRALAGVLGCSALHFVHFPLVAVFAAICLARARTRVAIELTLWLACLACAIAGSGLNGRAGLLNVLLDFLLLGEPFLLLSLFLAESWTASGIRLFRVGLATLLGLHVIAAHVQAWVLRLEADQVKGLFQGQGAGHHVVGAVALTGAVWLISDWPAVPRVVRLIAGGAGLGVVVIADAKQVLAVFLGSLFLLAWADRRRALRYLGGALAMGGMLTLASWTVLPSLGSWAKAELICQGLAQKLSVFSVIESYRAGLADRFLGLGPGHTVGRLGWMLPEYERLLAGAGATRSAVTEAVWEANESHWMSRTAGGSSFWSLLFSWAGIWGDLGWLGVLVYAGIWRWAWVRLAGDSLGRFLVLNLLLFGCVFAWLEEPGYMLTVAGLLGLLWQEGQGRRRADGVLA